MDHHVTESIRNIALLQQTGTIGQAGTIERGDTLSDYDLLWSL